MTRAPLLLTLALAAAGGALLAAPSARAQQTCMTDGDCAEGFECDLPPMARVDCDPGAGDCAAAKPAPRVGECEPAELRCQIDSDCPSGLTCDANQDGDCTAAALPSAGNGSAGAGAETPPDEQTCEDVPSEGECVFTLTECSQDSQCDGDEVCTPLSRTSECSGGAATCSPGQDCPAPAEDVCTETTHSYCFPPPVKCAADTKCPSNTRCVALPEDAQKDPPPGWEGATGLCLPETWALVLEGRVEVEGGSGSSESASDLAADRGGAKSDQAGGSAAGSDDAPDDLVAADDDGCAVRVPGAHSAGSSLPVVGLALLGLAYRRRRVARR